jgi:hypothetical protein
MRFSNGLAIPYSVSPQAMVAPPNIRWKLLSIIYNFLVNWKYLFEEMHNHAEYKTAFFLNNRKQPMRPKTPAFEE